MKKLLCLLLALAMLLSVLVSCSEDDNQTDNPQGETPTNEDPTNNEDPNPVVPTTDEDDPKNLTFTEYDTNGYHIYVSTTGSNKNDGTTADKAVLTLDKASELARAYMKANGETGDKETIVISIEGGNYYLSDIYYPVSGTDKYNIVYTSRGGYAKLIGGIQIKESEIKLCDDDNVLTKVRDESARDNLYEINLSAYEYYLTSLEARVGNVQISPLVNSYFGLYKTVNFTENGTMLTPARWPNEGESVVNESVSRSKDCLGYLTTTYINFTGNDGKMLTPTEVNKLGTKSTLPMNVFLDDTVYKRVSTWDWSRNDLFASDFFSNNWDDRNHQVTFTAKAFKSPTGTTYKGYITTDYGRNYNNEMATADGYGNADFRRWYFYNVLEEIDVAGEFYFDKTNAKMYYYPGEGKTPENIVISTSKNAVVSLTGSTYKGVKNVEFRNIVVRNSQSSLVHVAYADNVLFEGCEIANAAGDGLVINYSKNVTVRNCDLHSFGTTALIIGECEQLKATEQIGDAKILIDNCLLHDVGIIHHSYARTMNVNNSAGVTIKNCSLYDGPHGALGFANSAKLIFEYNDVYDFLTETDDAGVFYAYDGEIDNTIGITIRYNYIHDIGGSWNPQGLGIFYQDSYTIGYQVHHNVIENLAKGSNTSINVFGAMFAGHAHDNIVANLSNKTKISTYDGTLWNNQLGWWRIIYSEETWENNGVFNQPTYNVYTQFDPINSGFYGLWAESECATDEELGATYRALVRLRSRDFFCDMFGHLILVFNKDSILVDNCCKAFTGTDIDGITVKLDANCSAVKSSKYALNSEFTSNSGKFTDIDTLVKWMYDELGYDATCFEEGTLPTGVSIYYNGTKALKVFANKYTPDGLGDWKLSPTATALGLTDTVKGFFKTKGAGGYATNMAVYYLASDLGYFGEYTHNLTINCPLDFSLSDWNSPTIKATKYYDEDNVEITVVKDGEYTEEFIEHYYDLCDSGKFEYMELPDVTKMGSTLLK